MPDKEKKEKKNFKGKGRKDFDKEDKGGKFKGKDYPNKDNPLGTNDISWWMMSEQTLNDVGRLPFGRPLGNAQELGLFGPFGSWQGNAFGAGSKNMPAVIPGIAVINYRNSFGISGDAHSPINVAARAIYSYVRHANSGHANYESPDLMIYLFAIGEIYSGLAYLAKVYGTTQFWSQRNRYFGDRLVKALGFNPDDVREHLSDFRAQINLAIIKANSLVAPKNIALYERRYFLPSYIYKDEDNEKAQIYTFKPTALGRFSGTKANTGSILIPVACPWAGGQCTVKQAVDYINTFLDEILAEEDLGIMAGDILKAFGDGGVHRLLTIPDNYFVAPVYNEEMLQQIHNMNIGAYDQPIQPSDWDTWTITISAATDILRVNGATGFLGQLNGYLLTDFAVRQYVASVSLVSVNTGGSPGGSVSGYSMPLAKVSEFVMDSHLDQPDPKDVMIASRLFFDLTDTAFTFAGANHILMRSCGTEVVVSITVTATDEERVLSSKAIIESRCEYGSGSSKTALIGIADDSNNTYEEDEEAAHLLLKFRKAPVLIQLKVDYEFAATGDVTMTNTKFTTKFFNDIDVVYAAPLGSRVLENLHQSALLSVFRVPQIGMWTVK